MLIDDTGAVQNYYTYDPFGTLFDNESSTTTVENPYRFAGYFWDDEIKQYYNRARMYDPVLQRFTSIDPVRGGFREPLTLHQYLYCVNDPVNNWDPSGESFIGQTMVAIGIGASIYGAADLGWNIGAAITGRITMRQLGMQLLIDAAISATGTGLFKLGSKLMKMAAAGKDALKLQKAVTRSSDMPITNPARLLTAPIINKHHIFPREFEDFFRQKGIDIDEFCVKLGQSEHLGGIHGRGGYVGSGNEFLQGRYNKKWKEFIDNNPGATPEQIYQQGGKMMDEFGLSGLDIVRSKE